jgi:glycosyltransferase involved in cell wall biosynthesis
MSTAHAVPHANRADRVAPPSALRTRTVLFVEASTGGVVGGSLTGLVHQMRGMPSGWRSALVLYEPKSIESELASLGVRTYRVSRWRVPREHALQGTSMYHAARQAGVVRNGLHLGRELLRTVIEEFPVALALARIIRAERADIVHLGNGVRANFDGILASWLTRTGCVVHGKGFEKFSARERLAARRLDAVVCMTQAIRDHYERTRVRAPRMPVIYDAVDAEDFRPRRPRDVVRAELGLSPEACAVGILGGVQEWKGQSVVVEAAAKALPRIPELRCLIVGGVHRAGRAYAEGLERRVRELGLGAIVQLTGFRQDVPDVANALDIVVHASTRPEPFGRVILEAMLLARPVIAASAGGVPELIEDGETGFLVPPGNPEALAQRIMALARDPERRRRIGAEAQRQARSRFGLAPHVQAMTALYETILRERHA